MSGIILLMIISFAVILADYAYSVYIVKDNLIIAQKNALNIYTNNMDNILENATADLDALIKTIDDFSELSSKEDRMRYFMAVRVKDAITNRMGNNSSSDALIVYNSESDTYLSEYSNAMSVEDKWNLMEAVKSNQLIKTKRSERLKVLRINDSIFLYKMYDLKTTKLISVVTPKTLMSLVDTTSDEEALYLLMDYNQSIILSNTAVDGHISDRVKELNIVDKVYDSQEYIIINHSLKLGEVGLTAVLSEVNVLLNLSGIQWFIIGLASLTFILMPFIIRYLIKEIIRPINALIKGIGKIENGDLDYQVPIIENSKEFVQLTETFNNMVKEIKNLKIGYYEEQLELKMAELKYLQSQLKPHFMMNAITTIHSLTYKDNNEVIRTYIDALLMHFRYIIKGAVNRVKIHEEIVHVKNYIAMQEIRFPGSVFFLVDVEDEAKESFIPQLLLVTLVENAFKHAMMLDEILTILIRIETIQKGEQFNVHMIIEDNGDGFDNETIQYINSVRELEKPEEIGIGLSNIKKTLNLLYGNRGKLEIGKAIPKGARVEIEIPMEVDEYAATDS